MNNYFSHDSNARNDEKLIRLRMKHKATGYGVYFMILERMREEEDYMCAKDYNMIAFDLREDAELIRSVVEDFGLFCFTDDGEHFYSPSFLRRMEDKDERQKAKSEARSAAGKKGMANRWGTMTKDNKTITNEEEKESQERKVKEETASPSPAPTPVQEDTLEREKLELTSNTPWIESVCMRYHLHPDSVFNSISDFFLDCRARGKLSHNNLQDAQSHFSDWLRINLKQQQNNENNNFATSTKEQRAAGYAERISQLLAEDRQASDG